MFAAVARALSLPLPAWTFVYAQTVPAEGLDSIARESVLRHLGDACASPLTASGDDLDKRRIPAQLNKNVGSTRLDVRDALIAPVWKHCRAVFCCDAEFVCKT